MSYVARILVALVWQASFLFYLIAAVRECGLLCWVFESLSLLDHWIKAAYKVAPRQSFNTVSKLDDGDFRALNSRYLMIGMSPARHA